VFMPVCIYRYINIAVLEVMVLVIVRKNFM